MYSSFVLLIACDNITVATFEEGYIIKYSKSRTGYSIPALIWLLLISSIVEIALSSSVAVILVSNVSLPALIASYTRYAVINLVVLAGSHGLSILSP